MEDKMGIGFEELGAPASDLSPGTVVTFTERNKANWLGFAIERQGGREAELVALLQEGSDELKSTIVYANNVTEVRMAYGQFTARLAGERQALFPPARVVINKASLYLDEEGSPWIEASDQFETWWVRLKDGKRSTPGQPGLPSRGYSSWTLWRKVDDEDETLIGTMTSRRGE